MLAWEAIRAAMPFTQCVLMHRQATGFPPWAAVSGVIAFAAAAGEWLQPMQSTARLLGSFRPGPQGAFDRVRKEQSPAIAIWHPYRALGPGEALLGRPENLWLM